ncbi:MAG: hypothetical protein GY803_24070, partial [Chloroflexi bacterium]|nr:hypothetical protein [Chloroflexota bacterium]
MNKCKPSIPHTILYLQTGSRWKWLLAAVIIALAAVGAGIPARAHAQTQDEITMTAVAGLDGYCKNQTWFPVRVTLENTGAGIEGQIVVTTPGNMSASWLYTQAVSLPSVSRKEVTILVFPRRSLSSVTIALTADEE